MLFNEPFLSKKDRDENETSQSVHPNVKAAYQSSRLFYFSFKKHYKHKHGKTETVGYLK